LGATAIYLVAAAASAMERQQHLQQQAEICMNAYLQHALAFTCTTNQ
jgi:hypothetical protein